MHKFILAALLGLTTALPAQAWIPRSSSFSFHSRSGHHGFHHHRVFHHNFRFANDFRFRGFFPDGFSLANDFRFRVAPSYRSPVYSFSQPFIFSDVATTLLPMSSYAFTLPPVNISLTAQPSLDYNLLLALLSRLASASTYSAPQASTYSAPVPSTYSAPPAIPYTSGGDSYADTSPMTLSASYQPALATSMSYGNGYRSLNSYNLGGGFGGFDFGRSGFDFGRSGFDFGRSGFDFSRSGFDFSRRGGIFRGLHLRPFGRRNDHDHVNIRIREGPLGRTNIRVRESFGGRFFGR